MAVPKLGDFVWVYWLIGTQYASAGTVTGAEYTEHIAALIDSGYGVLTDKPTSPTRPPTNPNGVVTRSEIRQIVDELAAGTYARGSAVAFQGSEPPDLTALPSGTEYIWWKTDGEGNILDLLSGVKA